MTIGKTYVALFRGDVCLVYCNLIASCVKFQNNTYYLIADLGGLSSFTVIGEL